MKISKTIRINAFQERETVREFKDSAKGYKFLAEQTNNEWREYFGDLKPGTYAYAGGSWHNVKNLHPSILAQI
jgi:hypothetical protein